MKEPAAAIKGFTITPSELGIGETANINFTVVDAANHPIRNASVSLSLDPGMGKLSDIKNLENGSYTAQYTAGEKEGTDTLTVSIQDVKPAQGVITIVEQEVYPSKSSVIATSPIKAGENSIVTIILKDKNDKPISDRKMSITVDGIGTFPTEPSNNQGMIETAIKNLTKTGSYLAKISVEDGSIKFPTQLIEVKPGDPQRIDIDASPSVQSGESVDMILRVFDKFENPIPGVTINISISPEIGTLSRISDNQNGSYTFTYKPTEISSEKDVTLTATPGPVKNKAYIIRVLPTSKPSKTIELEVPKRIERGEKVNIKITATNLSDAPISDADIQVETDMGTLDPLVKVGNGIYTVSLYSQTIGVAVIKASIKDGPTDIESIEVIDTRAVIYSGDVNPLIAGPSSILTITAQAEEKGDMSFSIGNIVVRNPMQEISSGQYRGSYAVTSDIHVQDKNITVTLFLKDTYGNFGDLTVNNRVAIDTIPPPAPKNLMASGISSNNVSINATATAGRKVFLWVTKDKKIIIEDKNGIADINGSVSWRLNASTWEDGEYHFQIAEEPDTAGNLGEIAEYIDYRVTVKPPDGDVKMLLKIYPSSPILYNTEAKLSVTLVFFKTRRKNRKWKSYLVL